MKKDPVGQALLDFHLGKKNVNITVRSDEMEDDEISASYFFREFNEMPLIEQKALEHCKGSVLDIGAGAGSHAKWLQDQKHSVCALDISEGAVEVMQHLKVENSICADFYTHQFEETYDTILLLMNGIGIAGSIKGLDQFFIRIKSLLNTGGQIILDSSDLTYLYTEEDGSVWVDLNGAYFGEMEYQMSYKDQETAIFPWLYIDFDLLAEKAVLHGFTTEKVVDGDHYDYLAKLSLL